MVTAEDDGTVKGIGTRLQNVMKAAQERVSASAMSLLNLIHYTVVTLHHPLTIQEIAGQFAVGGASGVKPFFEQIVLEKRAAYAGFSSGDDGSRKVFDELEKCGEPIDPGDADTQYVRDKFSCL